MMALTTEYTLFIQCDNNIMLECYNVTINKQIRQIPTDMIYLSASMLFVF